MINWAYFPQSQKPNSLIDKIIGVFKIHQADIDSSTHETQVSDEALSKLATSLESIGFEVERGKKKTDKIYVPVLFGKNGLVEKSFEADAYHREGKLVLEVEAGRGVTNYQFLKDLFQACIMQDIEVLAIAVRNQYKSSQDFNKVFTFFDTLYKSQRLQLPLEGVLIIGY